MKKTISNTDQVVDSRDIISRLEELQDEKKDLEEKVGELLEEGTSDEERKEAEIELAQWVEDNQEELEALEELAEQGEGVCCDWKYGATLIHESYFVDYCQELCQDIGDLPKDIPSYLVIDWDATAENLKVDYSTLEWDGENYYVR